VPKVKVRFLGIIADEVGINELIINAENLLELLNKLKHTLPKAEKYLMIIITLDHSLV